MKKLISLCVLCAIITLTGCANTANGIHEDWREGTQHIANATNN